MKVCCFGSLNLDYVYRVREFVRAGETISSLSRSVVCGGKGLNQSVAMARCGARVFHAGNVGAADGEMLMEMLASCGADISLVRRREEATGHAIIQVDDRGENCILLYGGSNRLVSREQIEDVLSRFEPGDFMVLQNEVNMLPEIVRGAHDRGMRVVLNPSPVNDCLKAVPMEFIDYLFVNRDELRSVSGIEDAEPAMIALRRKYPEMTIVCTLGAGGATVYDGSFHHREGRRAKVVDTTGAGDTFLGYYVGLTLEGRGVEDCLGGAIAAATLCVEAPGASVSIPRREKVDALLAKG